MEYFRDSVSNGNKYTKKYINLTADIDLSDRTWSPIGVNYSDFEGIFDGQGHTISNMKFKAAQNGYNSKLTYDYQGLFGVIRNSAEVKNLTVKGEITITTGNINFIGGVVGLAYENSRISNVTSYVNITDGGTAYEQVNHIGGIVGRVGNNQNEKETAGHIDNCKYYGKINVKKASNAGGIVGCAERDSFVTNSTNHGSITGGFVGHIAGVAGAATVGAHVLNCANYGDVTNCYNDCIGGVVGYANEYVTINNCLNGGKISAKNDNGEDAVMLGGILGYQYNANFNGLTNCFNYGTVTALNGSASYTGAIVGNSKDSTGAKNVQNNYYLKDSCAQACGGYGGTNNTVVSAEEAQSGELAYKLQGTQEEQVWGQTLSGDNATPYPVLGGDAVHKVTFMSSGEIYATKYANETGIGMLPNCPTNNGEWRLGETVTDTKFTAETPISSDITVYEVIQMENKKDPDVTISTVDEFEAFRDNVNGGNTYEGKYILLAADIDLKGSEEKQWTPIGNRTNQFKGTFDGDGHKITGLYINNSSDYMGLFGYVGEGSTVKNLSVDGTVTANSCVAAWLVIATAQSKIAITQAMSAKTNTMSAV